MEASGGRHSHAPFCDTSALDLGPTEECHTYSGGGDDARTTTMAAWTAPNHW